MQNVGINRKTRRVQSCDLAVITQRLDIKKAPVETTGAFFTRGGTRRLSPCDTYCDRPKISG